MSKTIVPTIKTAPDIKALTAVKTYTPPANPIPSGIYLTSQVTDKNGVINVSDRVTNPPPWASALSQSYCYIRNNRIVGNFATIADAQAAMDYHCSREIEYGSDI